MSLTKRKMEAEGYFDNPLPEHDDSDYYYLGWLEQKRIGIPCTSTTPNEPKREPESPSTPAPPPSR